MELRNVALIAHVDHGKTTLVDALFRATGKVSRSGTDQERQMDRNDIERERGITILSKNAAVDWNGVRINLIDTPGHADFGGQVERVLSMASGVLLLVDAREGPMPQTRFVIKKALEHGLPPIVVVNKADRPDGRPEDVVGEVFDLFADLGAEELALDFPTLYASARDGWASADLRQRDLGMAPLLDAIVKEIPAPKDDPEGPCQYQVSTLDWSDYVGRIGIGRVRRGSLKRGSSVSWLRNDGTQASGRIKELFGFEGMERVPRETVGAGDIAAVSGIERIGLGDTLCDPEMPEALPPIEVEEPTIEMEFRVNDGPLAGQEGKFVTSRQVQERLERARMMDPALRVETGGDSSSVAGRGVLHIGILMENMRREGYEFCVGKPRVLFREIDGKRHEPVETTVVEVPADYMGKVIEYFGQRGARIGEMDRRGDRAVLTMIVPTRGMMGARTQVLSLTRGEGIVHAVPAGYEPDQGTIVTRRAGALIASDSGKATAYSLRALEDRGEFFVKPGDPVFTGMIVGENNKDTDLELNVVRGKKLTNVRSAHKEIDEKIRAARDMGLETCLEFLEEDEMLEVTPQSLRLRKRLLNAKDRKRAATH